MTDDDDWRRQVEEMDKAAEAEAQRQIDEQRRRHEAEIAAARQRHEEEIQAHLAEAQRRSDELSRQMEAARAAAQQRVDEASAAVERAAAEARARRLGILRRRMVKDPEAALARIEKEAHVEAERARPLIEQRVAEELRRIRAALDLRLRQLQALPTTPEREQEIADARIRATADEHIARMRGQIEITAREVDLVEAKVGTG